MRRIHLIEAATILAAVLAASGSAQTNRPATGTTRSATVASTAGTVPEARIALINTEEFADEKTGIARYVSAVKSLEREFQPRQTEIVTMQNSLKGIADEISKLNGAAVVNPQAIQAKQDEGERLQRELKRIAEDAQAAYKKRSEAVLSPISQDIGKAIDQFATQHGFTLVLDLSKLSEAILSINPATDVTQSFIADYNSKNPPTATPGPQ